MHNNCAEKAVEVRQWGANATYPPTSGIATNEGLTARFDLGGGQAFVANLTKEVIIHDQIVYARALGSVTGGIEGQEQYQGRGAYEEYVYGLLPRMRIRKDVVDPRVLWRMRSTTNQYRYHHVLDNLIPATENAKASPSVSGVFGVLGIRLFHFVC
ncbi:unnamed protein product [Aspergillus oryzae]|uniref:Unnamed protein product n=2 Tax=Aspergillus oryzae TaxID=5062 RepID=A0AAN5BWN4_ASPOZ|nr:unnamed protein product [Aspergillus oryzae]